MISPPNVTHHAGARVDTRWTALAIGAIAFATVTPRPAWNVDPYSLGFLFPTTPRGWLDVFANVLLYLPLGIAVAGRGASTIRACLTALGCSLATELVQSVIPGRTPSGTDVLCNVLGATLGCVVLGADVGGRIRWGLASLSRWLDRLVAPESQMAARLSLAWASVIATVLGLTAFLLGPSLPSPPYVVPGPLLDARPGPLRIGSSGVPGDSFRGAIDEVRIYDRALPQNAVRADMLRGVAASPGKEEYLLAAYSFDAAGGPVAHDRSAHARHGEIRDAAWIPQGRFGGALMFDGRASEVIVPAGDWELRDGMTLEAWIRVVSDRAGPAPPPIPGNENPWSTVIARGGSVYLHASTLAAPFLPAGGGWFAGLFETARTARPIATDTWTHLAVTYDSQAFRLYVDGDLQSSTFHWSPHRLSFAALGGDSLPLHDGRHLDVRTPLLRDLDLRLTVECGAPSVVRAPLFLIATTYSAPVLRLDAEGEDVWIRSSTVGSELGLPTPDVRVPGALAACVPGRTVDLTLTGTLRHPHLAIGSFVSRGVGANPASGWALLMHSAVLPLWLQRLFGVAWLGMLFLPFGFWLRRARASAFGITLLTATLGVLFSYWPAADFDPVQLLVAPAAVALGAMAQRARRRDGPTHAKGARRDDFLSKVGGEPSMDRASSGTVSQCFLTNATSGFFPRALKMARFLSNCAR